MVAGMGCCKRDQKSSSSLSGWPRLASGVCASLHSASSASVTENVAEGGLTAPDGKLAAKPDGADRGGILVARAVRRKRLISDGNEVMGLALDSATAEGIFADHSLGLESKVLQINRLIHENRHF